MLYMSNFNSLCPVGLVSDAVRLQVSEDTYPQTQILLAMLESENADIDMTIDEERSVSVQPHNVHKLTRKQRRAARRVQNHRHALRDRYHGKCGKEHRYAGEYADHDFRMYCAGMVYNRNMRRKTLDSATLHDALDISLVERLTASILAEMSHSVFMWDEVLVHQITDAICDEYRIPYPDDSYIVKDGAGKVTLIFQVERFEPGYGSYVEETVFILN